MTTVRIARWSPSPTSKAGACFYPPIKYIGQVVDADGNVIRETGKCATREAARRNAKLLVSA